MKIKPSDSTSAVRAPQTAPAAKTPAPVETNGWQAKAPTRAAAPVATPPSDATVKQAVTQLAHAAVSQALIEEKPAHPMLEKFGKDLGLVAILVHSLTDFNMHVPANAILAIALMAGEVASTVLSRMAVPVLYYMSQKRQEGAQILSTDQHLQPEEIHA